MEESAWVKPTFLCAALTAAFLPGLLGKLCKRQRKRAATHSKAYIYRHNLLQSIQNTPIPPLSTEKQAQILSSSLSELHTCIASRTLTCTEVVTAYIKQIQSTGVHLNAIVDERFSAAIQEAEALDQDLASGRTPGPLYGIPFSVKDMICVQSCISTFGLARLCHNRIGADSLIISALKAEGAIPLVKGSMPQLGSSIETVNGIAGRCLNPRNRERTPGGSSGGDAALVASVSVGFALGGDVAGSIRIPASFTGIYGLRPTSARTSAWGPLAKLSFPGYHTAWGPLARSITDLALILQVWCSDFIYQKDPLTPPIPYKPHFPAISSLRIGYITTDVSAPPCKTSIRAVLEAVEILRKLGCEVVEFQVPGLRDYAELGEKYFTAFGEGMDEEIPDSEPLFPTLRQIYRAGKTPRLVKKVFAFLARLFNYPSLGFSLYSPTETPSGPSTYSTLYSQLQILKTRFQTAWKSAHIDLLIAPFPAPATPNNTLYDRTTQIVWTLLFNLVDFPVGLMPWTQVSPSELDYVGVNSVETKVIGEVLEGAVGLPVGLQVVGKPYKEEYCLALMQALELGKQ